MAKLPKFIPLPSPPQGPLLEEPEEREARMRAYAGQVAKIKYYNLTLLFDYFDIEKTGDAGVDFALLAMCLADKHIHKFNSVASGFREHGIEYRPPTRADSETKLSKNFSKCCRW